MKDIKYKLKYLYIYIYISNKINWKSYVLINKSITIIKYVFEKKQKTYVNQDIWSRNKDHLHDYIQ
jgi:hypothetical protein